jgi:glycosyltransferase involved in cell wall biosynthesis
MFDTNKPHLASVLLIIGKRPPPVGGVTIHVDRLLMWLDKSSLSYRFYDLNHFSILSFIGNISKFRYVHLHSSSPILRLLFVFICQLLNKVSIVTIHGNLGRYNKFYNILDSLAVKFSRYPIVINQKSFLKAMKLNKSTILISAYIPSIYEKDLEETITDKLINMRKSLKLICVTNAYNYSTDKDGTEIYGILDLVAYFHNHLDYGFIISDPSGSYSKIIDDIPSNIIIIGEPHSFIKVLQFADCFIRYTSTDGDSLSIHEALDNNVSVIATDVVDRPHGVLCVPRGDFNKLDSVFDSLLIICKDKIAVNYDINNIAILNFYKEKIYL